MYNGFFLFVWVLCWIQHLIGQIWADSPPNLLSRISNQWFPISQQLTYYLTHNDLLWLSCERQMTIRHNWCPRLIIAQSELKGIGSMHLYTTWCQFYLLCMYPFVLDIGWITSTFLQVHFEIDCILLRTFAYTGLIFYIFYRNLFYHPVRSIRN